MRRLCAAIILLAVIIPGLPATVNVADVAAAPAKANIAWSTCYRQFGPFECGTVQVPLDYDSPNGATISIAVVRLPATDPERRIGSLFLNPGGPGGSGVDLVVFAGPFLYTEEVRAKFDLVGFDPRGIGRSTALRCFGNPRQWGPFFSPFPFPMTTEEEQIWIAGERFLASNCDQRGGKIRDHMSTANVARDLDLLRQAVGDEQLTFAGYSYGSYLGVTYANLFPDNVRALVVDGVLDPIAWSTGVGNQAETLPFSTRLRSDAGAQATLDEFFRLCDAGGANCAFSGDAAGRFADLADSLLANPSQIPMPDGSVMTFGYSHLIATTLGAMYNSFAWPDFAQFLAALESFVSPAQLGAQVERFMSQPAYITKRGFPRYPNLLEGFPSVACSDSDNPDSYADWSAAAVAAEAQFGYFGRIWTWITSICAVWPGADSDRYMGPWDAETANPVLVVGTEFDPATRYEGAVTVAGLLPNSALLTVHGWGHTSLFLSQCADAAVAAYLIDGTTPAPGTVCEQDIVPFAGP